MRPQSSDLGGCLLAFIYLVVGCVVVYAAVMIFVALIQAGK